MSFSQCVWISACVCALVVAAAKGETPQLIETLIEELEIQSFHVQTLVVSRYATTTISCKISNPATVQREAQFSVMLPNYAFISNLTIEAGGQNYTSQVQEREQARQTYELAKIKGTNAAIIHQKERETSRFRVDVSVAAREQVTFYLSYEELMSRRLGKYTLKINVHPSYPVRDVLVDLVIHETRNISSLKVIKVPGGENYLGAVTESRDGTKTARLQFDPDPGSLPQKIPLHGQFVVEYDVERSLDPGDVQIENGYFVHFFAPVGLQHTPKDITFLIDTSFSMEGIKLEQVKDALKKIVSDLNGGDSFTLIEFNSVATTHIKTRHSLASIGKTLKIIDSLSSSGSTNIDEALKDATQENSSDDVRSNIIILLTDGQPSEGERNRNVLLKSTRDRNRNRYTIFTLAFGDNADFTFLETLALQNGGFAKKIYVDYDAADQLRFFYEDLATPLLLDVRFAYSDSTVVPETLTKINFQNYFLGTELVVSGQIQPFKDKVKANITGQGRNGEFTMAVTDWSTVLPPDQEVLSSYNLQSFSKNIVRRLWAFLMIKDLLNQEKAAIKSEDRKRARGRALYLALQYHFVTPLTSLVVVQPDSEECKDYEDEEYYDEAKYENGEESEGETVHPTNEGPVSGYDDKFNKTSSSKYSNDLLNSISMKNVLSPRIYGQYGTSKHPDEKILAEMNKGTILHLNSASISKPLPCLIPILLILHKINSIVYKMLQKWQSGKT